MNMSGRTSITCTQMIRELALDPYYGQRLLKDESKEREDPDSEIPLLIRKGLVDKDKNITGESFERPDWSAKTVYFEIRSEYVEPILKSIYEWHPSKQYFETAFNLLPCKSDRLRFLVYTWCGPLGLPYTRDGHSIENQEIDILKNWLEEFEIKLEDLKVFLRKNNWPLPVNTFDDEADNTRNKISLSDKEFEKLVRNQVELLPILERRLKELNAIQPESMAADGKKKQEILKVEKDIQIIKKGGDPKDVPSPLENRNSKIWKKALEYRPPNKKIRSWRWIADAISKMDISEDLEFEGVREILKSRKKTEKMGGD